MTFRVGQKVVCVDAKGRRDLGLDFIHNDAPVKGSVYTIARLTFERGEECIVLVEHPRSVHSKFEGYAARRFRPIVERKTSIEIFTRMLNPSRENMDA